MRLTFAGHFNPLLVLAKAARDDGHKVEFITGPRKHAMLASAGIDAPILTSSGPDTLEAIANTKSPVSGNPIKTESVTVRPFVGYGFEDYDAIIHHGGAGVTCAAILASLPSLVIPRDYDQFD